MKNLHFLKQGQCLVPFDPETAERIKRVKQGALCQVELVQPRNYQFHKKFFAMLNFAFDYWEPPEREYKGMEAAKDFNEFRKGAIIQAGYYDVVSRIDGSVKLVARSISFGSMSEEEFAQLYKSVFDVLWNMVMKNIQGMTREVTEDAINQQLLTFN